MKPAFVVEDQSAVIAALERRLAPARRIDTHGAVVFLSGDRAYKLKRAVKFPYMDFSTAERRRAMCEAEVDINRRLAPEIYLGVEPVRAGSATDWVVVMRRFDEDGLLDRRAERGQLTPALMASLGARIARYHDGLAPIRDGFGRPDDYRHSVAADIRQMRDQGERLDPAASEALALLPMFLSRRASIRAFVDASIAAVGGGDTARARDYQRVALGFLQPAPPSLLAIGGLSGSGKTTRALQVAPEIGRAPGAVVVRSDVERKRLAGVPLEQRMPAGSYTQDASAKVYAVMFERAEQALRAGQSVVVDAVFAKPEERQAAESLARKIDVPFEGLWLDVPKEVAQARVAARTGDASDATPNVIERQFGYDLGEITWRHS